MKDIDLGDILENGSIVESVMKIDNKHKPIPLYVIKNAGVNKEDIYVTGSHLVLNNDTKQLKGLPGIGTTIMDKLNEYADQEELGLFYRKIAKAFSSYQPTIDDPGEFDFNIQENRIVGPLSDTRTVEQIEVVDIRETTNTAETLINVVHPFKLWVNIQDIT